MAHQAGREAQDGRLSAPASASLEEMAARLQQIAVAQGISVGTAESCTGGLVGHAITMLAGSSGYYRGGVVSYADEVKVSVLGVPRTASLDMAPSLRRWPWPWPKAYATSSAATMVSP